MTTKLLVVLLHVLLQLNLSIHTVRFNQHLDCPTTTPFQRLYIFRRNMLACASESYVLYLRHAPHVSHLACMSAATASATTLRTSSLQVRERCHDLFDTSPRFPQRFFSFGAISTAWQHPKALGASSHRSLLGGHKTAVQGCHEIGGRVRLGAGATHSDSAAANTARPRGRGIAAGGCGHQLPAHIL
jgi:hypothetical protein